MLQQHIKKHGIKKGEWIISYGYDRSNFAKGCEILASELDPAFPDKPGMVIHGSNRGAVVSSLASYAIERKCARQSEEFGRGAIEGGAGPESANNAASSSSFIPLLTLGIPGNASIPMIFAALMIQGITPGPFLIKELGIKL